MRRTVFDRLVRLVMAPRVWHARRQARMLQDVLAAYWVEDDRRGAVASRHVARRYPVTSRMLDGRR